MELKNKQDHARSGQYVDESQEVSDDDQSTDEVQDEINQKLAGGKYISSKPNDKSKG